MKLARIVLMGAGVVVATLLASSAWAAFTSVTPDHGPMGGGTSVLLCDGTGMCSATSVTFGGTPAFENACVINACGPGSDGLLVTTGAHAPAVVDVVLNEPTGTITIAGGYSYTGPQTITFPQPGNVPTGWSFFHFATASSHLPVTVTSNTPSICTVSGDLVTLAASPGTCTLTADQAGGGIFQPAPSVSVSFTVFLKNNAMAAQLALLGTNSSWRVTPVDPGNTGWNSDVAFNDSGWQAATNLYDVSAIYGPPFFCKGIWSSGGANSMTETTVWARRVLFLNQVPAQAWMEMGADDDVDLYINGVQVVNDVNGVSNNISRDIHPYLLTGNNLFAFTVRDNFLAFGYQHSAFLQVRSNIGTPILPTSVPAPRWALGLLAVVLLAAGALLRRARPHSGRVM